MKKIAFVLLIFIFFNRWSFSDNKRKLINRSFDALTIERCLTYTDFSFFVGLGMLTKVFGEDVNLYIKRIRTGKEENNCREIKYKPDIKKIEINKKGIVHFNYKREGDVLILNSFFQYNGSKYLLIEHRSMSGARTVLYKIVEKEIKKVKELKLSYIKNIKGILYGVDLKQPGKIFILDNNFDMKKRISLQKKEYMFTDFYKIGNDFVFKKVRFASAHPGFVSESGKSFFFKGQGKGKSLFESYMRNQIVFGEDDGKLYITFMFPDSPRYPVYVYSKDGKCEKTIYGNIEEYMWIPKGRWFDRGLPENNMEIVSVNKIFCDRGKIFVIIHRKTWGKPREKKKKVKKFVQIISKKGKFLGEKEIKIFGYPVYYDRKSKTFYFIREKDFTIREWTLDVKYY